MNRERLRDVLDRRCLAARQAGGSPDPIEGGVLDVLHGRSTSRVRNRDVQLIAGLVQQLAADVDLERVLPGCTHEGTALLRRFIASLR